ncbi:MAG: hypothetical protein JXL81_03950 [Deltaproteobacteria bacterium]|nr:hypothetical protein [Deltaproteobacteria bacterium]
MSKEYLQWENIRLIPIVHGRMEFALEVRRQFKEYRPDIIAVEYPSTLKDKIIQGVKRLPLLSVVHYEESDGIFTYLLVEPADALVEAVRLGLESDLPVHFIDRDTEDYPADYSPMPDAYVIARIGHYKYITEYIKEHKDDECSREDRLREKNMAYNLQKLNKTGQKILFVGGIYHSPRIIRLLDQPQTEVIGIRKRTGVGLSHIHSDSSREILSEMPFLIAEYENHRSTPGSEPPDRMKINGQLIDEARTRLWKNDKEELSPIQLGILARFARNYALTTGNLVPDFYQLIVASRGVADDNFAWEVWDRGSEYPWQTEEPGIPVIQLSGDDLFLNQRKIKFHRRIKGTRKRLISVPVKKRRREKNKGEWKERFNGEYICSYPPEDIVIEGYGRHLQKRAIEIKSEENSRVVPFESSMLDGLDLRETIKNFHEGKLYVRENRPLRGKVGSVVVIFDPDLADKEGNELFPWKVTWLGEHDQESDMAFYSTPAGDVMDGPGISRCQYGGFMLSYPPMRVYDVWKDNFFSGARNKPERLLMAAIDYCLEKHVVYVAATPPTGWCRSIAERYGKNIIYIPIGTIPPATLKRIRKFHVLDGHQVRDYASQYI